MQKEYNESEHLSFKEDSNQEQHGLRGVVQIYRKNKETGEVSFWDESHNIIPISGYDVVLMKLFGLFLDSSHGKVTDNLTRDTNLAIPDLNERLHIGVKPEKYTVMDEDISSDYICQGFMIGNGGAGEDNVTTKNTAYSFISLRNPIPFQQELNISPSIAGKYLGIYHGIESNGNGNLIPQSAYIKKFDERPHLYHSWWVDGQRWDYIDPVTQGYLGPDSENGVQKTNRIETYVECKLSLSDTDCQQYFKHVGNTQTAMVNELGLVAFDTVPGERSALEKLYSVTILPFLELVYKKNRTAKEMSVLVELNKDLYTMFSSDNIASLLSQNERLGVFAATITTVYPLIEEAYTAYSTQGSGHYNDLDYANDIIDQYTTNTNYDFSNDTSIHVTAYYNQNGVLMYVEDDYLTLLQDMSMADLTLDEAQRIKLVTYYTFNSIPISENWEILINYRIYAN